MILSGKRGEHPLTSVKFTFNFFTVYLEIWPSCVPFVHK